MKILVPKRYVALSSMYIPVLIAGPIGGGDDRQADFIRLVMGHLKKRATITLYKKIEQHLLFICPCRWKDDHSLAIYFEQSFTTDIYGQDLEAKSQTFWESHYAQQILRYGIGHVVFLLFPESESSPRSDGEPYGRDTLGELGRWSVYARFMGSDDRIRYALHEKWKGRTVFEKNLRFWTPEQTRNIHRSVDVNHFAEHFAEVLIRKFSN